MDNKPVNIQDISWITYYSNLSISWIFRYLYNIDNKPVNILDISWITYYSNLDILDI